MPFVKLDCGILRSTLWMDREARDCFITALLMAEPREFTAQVPQLTVRTMETTDFAAPPGWYGFVDAAGVGIVRCAGLEIEAGLTALERLGAPEPDSRSPDHGGRRLIRVDGGYLILNYIKYRERDYTTAERSRRYRERRKVTATRRDVTMSRRDTTVTSRKQKQKQSTEAEIGKEQERPPGLDLKAWEEWLAYKQASEHKLKPVSIPHAQRELAGFGAAQARVVSHSIANGWQGLFAPKNLPKAGKVQINPDGSVAMFAGKPVEWPSS